MSYVRVRPEQLESLAGRLDGAVEHVQSAARALADIGVRGVGSDDLDAACNELQQEWERGIDRIADLSGQLAQGLRDTARTYRGSDETSAADLVRLYERLGGVSP